MSALVTGASGGLGRAIAEALAGAGHDVTVHHRRDEAGAETTAEAVRAAGRAAHLVRVDLSTPLDAAGAAELDERCADLIAEAGSLGPLEVVVLNAFPQTITAWDELDTAAWDALYRDGLRQCAALVRAASGVLTDGGVIVTIGSIEGYRAAPGHAAYAVGKAGLHHLTAAAAHELGPRGIRVVGVAPGLIERDGLADDWPDGVRRWRAASALGRTVRPDEVAAVVAFLASPAAAAVTGTVLPVDAGWGASPGW